MRNDTLQAFLNWEGKDKSPKIVVAKNTPVVATPAKPAAVPVGPTAAPVAVLSDKTTLTSALLDKIVAENKIVYTTILPLDSQNKTTIDSTSLFIPIENTGTRPDRIQDPWIHLPIADVLA